jgi:uncharacterized membrane protein
VIYVVGFIFAAVSNFMWEPAKYVAVPCYFIGPVGAAVVAVLLLADGQRTDRLLLWCALAGGLLTTAFQLWVMLFVGSDDNSIGTVVIWVFGWLLMAVGALAKRSVPTHHKA